ncbi:MAG: DUF4435 domain-containing protein [Haemophilus pittmaniae]|uniref:DUF4435 domain-containing protein n=1 Tax=Haemophilus pittmaniae TaxID=249188 RepID=UPI0023F1F298|nr:DUF4435 domain-containing protein [Haemophilus pittmaniae]MBS6027095.1 DUF4435 domain-containing protein [Haemophilus pittmaniae]
MAISLDIPSKRNEILLQSKSPQYRNKYFVLVEGITDIKFFTKHFFQMEICFKSMNSGKPVVKESVDYLIKNGLSKIFGVCDADFDHIDNISYENILLTDFHDLEMFFIESSCLYKVFCEYLNDTTGGDVDKINKISIKIKKDVIEICSKIGLLRFINYRDSNINLNFKGMNFSEFISVSDSVINFDIDHFIEFLLRRSNNTPKEYYTKEYIISEYLKFNLNEFDYRHLCNGHDFVNILVIVLREISGNTNISREHIEENMRMGYESDCFKKTNLYRYVFNYLS